MDYQRIGIIGGGAWGTALAQSMRRAGRDVLLWAYEMEVVQEINAYHTNHIYLPGVTLDGAIRATGKTHELAECDILLMVAPSQFTRSVAQEMAPHIRDGVPVVICTKGVEPDTGKLMSTVLSEALPQATPAILSGPSFAAEVSRDLPAALTLASSDEALGAALVGALGHRNFRIYWSNDITGVQIGASVKNVLAIAAGIVVGRELGDSAHAAVTTRGFAELVRFGVKMGGRSETLMGLSGLGDLILTCSSTKSRNMSLGLALGQGKTADEVLGVRRSVSEGVHSVSAVNALADKLGVEMPICAAVLEVLEGKTDVDAAIDALLSRPPRAETEPPVSAA